jgi:hypothetical protein
LKQEQKREIRRKFNGVKIKLAVPEQVKKAVVLSIA